ncbi:hypothetical protein ABZP36_033327 [Zizania latifolia]
MKLSALGLFYFASPGYAVRFFARGSYLFGRCAVPVTVAIVSIYAEILAAAGACNERSPATQFSCCTVVGNCRSQCSRRHDKL